MSDDKPLKLPGSRTASWPKVDQALADAEKSGEKKRRRLSVYEAVEDILSTVPPGEQVEVRRLLAEVIVRKAMRGNVKMIEAILNRSDPVALQLTGADGNPIEFQGKLVLGLDAEAMRRGVDPDAPRDVEVEPPSELPSPLEAETLADVLPDSQESPCTEVPPE